MPRPRGRRRRVLFRAAGAGSALAVALGAGTAPALAAGTHGAKASSHAWLTLTLPAPTGHYQVGQVNLHLIDHSRPDPYIPGSTYRELMVTVWYPATSATSYPAAPWLQSVAAKSFLTNTWHVAPGEVALPTTAGHTGAPVDTAAGKLPILLYSTGLHSDRAQGTQFAEDLASRGYLVVLVDHTHDAGEVQFPGGRLEVNRMPAGTASSRTVQVRATDIKFTINELSVLAQGKNPDADGATLPKGLAGDLDMTKIGMFGWSLGGATVPVAMQKDSRIGAGVNLDGQFFGSVTSQNLSRPFMLFSSATHNRNTDSSWAALWSHLKGYRIDLKLQGSRHNSFADNEELLPQAANVLGMPQSQIQSILGTISPNRAVQVERVYLAAFFDQELRHVHSTLLDGKSSRYPEITFVP